MAKTSLGFIGVGRMGAPMATRLLAAGYHVSVYDTSAPAVEALVARGARTATSPRMVADEAEIVFASVPTPETVREIALGGEGVIHGSRVRIFVDFSTTGPRVAGEVDAALAATGRIVMIDSPVSGGAAGAANGTLTLMVAGPEAARAELAPIFKELGRVHICGNKPGHGQVVKLANNVMAATSLAVACEALVFGARAGVDPKLMMEIINVSSGGNAQMRDKVPRHILTRTFDFGSTTGLSQKDVRLCLDEAEALGVPMIIGSAARQVLALSKAAFGADADFTNMVRLFEGWAGVEVRPAAGAER